MHKPLITAGLPIDASENIPPSPVSYRANFLWRKVKNGSIEEAGYEFANARTEEYCKHWWVTLLARIKAQSKS